MAFAVHSEMRRWAAAPSNDGTHTILLTAFLTPRNSAGQQQIAGSFVHTKTSERDMLQQVALFIEGSAAALASGHATLHVVHDTAFADGESPRLPCVRFHRFANGEDAAESAIRTRAAATDRRWPLYERVMQRLDAAEGREYGAQENWGRWECAWAVDLTDVMMLRLPPCAALPMDRIAIGHDGLTGPEAHKWFRWLGAQGKIEHLWPGFERWLQTSRQPILNNGIVGGRRSAIAPFIRFSSRAVVRFWSRASLATNWSMDMLVSNQAVYDPAVRDEAGAAAAFPITGYPLGPVAGVDR